MTRLGKYELLQRLASGGMAEIWLARVSGPGGAVRYVALKCVRSDLAADPNFAAMFLDEARISMLLEHPNIVRVYDVGEENAVYFIAMEYLHGADVCALKRAGKAAAQPFSIELALAIGARICAGLHYAHERIGYDAEPLGLVHRDVSPSNVMITPEGHVALLDFGIAKARSRITDTRGGAAKGKVPYMSPEQILGRSVDRRTDIYATGAILYELTTGKSAFAGANEYEIAQRVLNSEFERPRALISDYPAALEELVLTAMAADATERFDSAEALGRSLKSTASSLGLDLGSDPIAAYMQEVYGTIPEPWLIAEERATSETPASTSPRPSARSIAYTSGPVNPQIVLDASVRRDADTAAARPSAGPRPRGPRVAKAALGGACCLAALLGGYFGLLGSAPTQGDGVEANDAAPAQAEGAPGRSAARNRGLFLALPDLETSDLDAFPSRFPSPRSGAEFARLRTSETEPHVRIESATTSPRDRHRATHERSATETTEKGGDSPSDGEEEGGSEPERAAGDSSARAPDQPSERVEEPGAPRRGGGDSDEAHRAADAPSERESAHDSSTSDADEPHPAEENSADDATDSREPQDSPAGDAEKSHPAEDDSADDAADSRETDDSPADDADEPPEEIAPEKFSRKYRAVGAALDEPGGESRESEFEAYRETYFEIRYGPAMADAEVRRRSFEELQKLASKIER